MSKDADDEMVWFTYDKKEQAKIDERTWLIRFLPNGEDRDIMQYCQQLYIKLGEGMRIPQRKPRDYMAEVMRQTRGGRST